MGEKLKNQSIQSLIYIKKVACRIVSEILFTSEYYKNNMLIGFSIVDLVWVAGVWSPGDFIFIHFFVIEISKLGVTLEVVMSHGYMHMKNEHLHMKEQPQINLRVKRKFLCDVIFMWNDVIENFNFLKIQFLTKDTWHTIYAYHSTSNPICNWMNTK